MTASEVERSWDEKLVIRIGNNIKLARGKRSAQWLADRTTELGFPIGRATISELETGRRKSISAAELLMIAYALDTSPVMLTYGSDLADKEIEALPGVSVSAQQGLLWHSGIDDSGVATELTEYERNNYPVTLTLAIDSALTSLKYSKDNTRIQEVILRELDDIRQRMRAAGMVVKEDGNGNDQ